MPRDGPSGSTGAEEQPVHEVKILTTGKALKLEPFRVPEDPLKVGRAWQEWLEDFEEETNYFEIKEIRDKVGALKIYGGSEITSFARFHRRGRQRLHTTDQKAQQPFPTAEKQTPRKVRVL